MKKSKKQNGITLIALIITIVVLLILAVVAIGAVKNDGIIEYAKNARSEYETAQTNEQTIIEGYLEELEYNDPSNTKWRQNGTIVTNGTITLNVGDTVDYVSNADTVTVDEELGEEITKKYESELGGTWKVLGAENGEILLMSTQKVGNTLNTTIEGFLILEGKDGLNGITQLNTICEAYGNGEHASKITKARSIKIEDINRVTGYNPRNIGVYDPLQKGEGTIYNEGLISEYGNVVTYNLTYTSDYDWISGEEYNIEAEIKYNGTNGVEGSSEFDYEYGNFEWLDGTNLKDRDIIKITSDYYSYYPTTLTNKDTDTAVGLSTNSSAYKMLFRNETNTENISYWLASEFISVGSNSASKGIYFVENGSFDGVAYYGTYVGLDATAFAGYYVRAVVPLESNVQLEANGKNAWKIVENS